MWQRFSAALPSNRRSDRGADFGAAVDRNNA
jgi:hypothetical protein